jgi:hypothetical protein
MTAIGLAVIIFGVACGIYVLAQLFIIVFDLVIILPLHGIKLLVEWVIKCVGNWRNNKDKEYKTR